MKLFLGSVLVLCVLELTNGAIVRKLEDVKTTNGTQKSATDAPPTLEITLPIYSGRPDPTWEITAQNPNYEKVRALYNEAVKQGFMYSVDMTPPVLGYKGFFIRPLSQELPNLVLGPQTKQLQQLLLQTAPPNTIPDDLVKTASQEIETSLILPAKPEPDEHDTPGLSKTKSCKRTSYGRATRFAWNNPIIKFTNNCYNYAVDKMITHYGTPGLGGGNRQVYDAPYRGLTKDMVIDGALSDGLVLVGGGTRRYWGPFPEKSTLTGSQHLVALFVASDGSDFHWYRRDDNNNWSHKSGKAGATNKVYSDNQYGITIDDPREIPHPGDDQNRVYQYAATFICDKKTAKLK